MFEPLLSVVGCYADRIDIAFNGYDLGILEPPVERGLNHFQFELLQGLCPVGLILGAHS
jgi:hypothetical protein